MLEEYTKWKGMNVMYVAGVEEYMMRESFSVFL
jgi:hypothetical protein